MLPAVWQWIRLSVLPVGTLNESVSVNWFTELLNVDAEDALKSPSIITSPRVPPSESTSITTSPNFASLSTNPWYVVSVDKPIILVPSPNVAENHQTKNAQSLVNKNSALMVKDVNSKRKLVEVLISLSKNKKLQKELISNIKKLAVTDAAEQIADISLGLLKKWIWISIKIFIL